MVSSEIYNPTYTDGTTNLRWSGHFARLLILEESKLANVHNRVKEFANKTGANISINSVSIAEWQKEVFADAGRNGPHRFDGYSLKGNWIPSLVEEEGLADLSDLFDLGTDGVWDDLEWMDIVPVVRDSICVYAGKVFSIPVDADYMVPAARDDILMMYNEGESENKSLDTWEEWVQFAEDQHGRDLNGDNIPDFGACLAKGEGNVHFSVFGALWSIVAPHLQTHGIKYGAFFDSTTFEPLWAQDRTSFVKALELYKRLVKVSMEGEVTAADAKNLFQSGRCATWLSLPGLVFGVQDTGGIKALNSTTATMKQFASPGVECASDEECPLAVEISTESEEESRLINRVPLFSSSGTTLSISSSANDSTRKLLLELYTYISAPEQSNTDVMLRTSFSDPFRNSQLNELATDRLVVMNGWDRSDAKSYHDVVATTLNDVGAALDLRVPGIDLYQNSALEAISPYVYGNDDTITASDASEAIIKAWDGIPTVVFQGSSKEAARDKMRDIYRAQLGLPPIVVQSSSQQINLTTPKIAVFIVPAIILLLAILSSIVAYVLIKRRKKQIDSIWAVKHEELKFGVMVGRSTFGLVLLADYRGTEVAVKRVIPPRNNERNNGTRSMIRRVSPNLLFGAYDENDTFEKEHRSSTFDCALSYDEEADINSGGSYYLSGSFSGSNKSRKRSKTAPLHRKIDLEKLRSEFIVEMRQLSKLRHPNIVTVMGAVIDPSQEALLIMEFMEKGSLYDTLRDETYFINGGLLLNILGDIAQGARFLHSANPQVIHGDIRSANILLDSKFRAKITDFGLSQKHEIGVAISTASKLWMAPELLRGESGNTTQSDVYSFGILLYEVYSKQDPYDGENVADVLKDVMNKHINKRPSPIPSNMPPTVSEIMKGCVDPDPNERPSFETLDLILKRLNGQQLEDKSNIRRNSIVGGTLLLHNNSTSIMNNLLYNVFPTHIADALKQGRKVEQENHECVTVFFSDIVGFTTISQSLSAQKVCQMLDRLYQKFDDLSDKHDIYKAETIGDAYMAIANLVKDQTLDHVKRIVEFSKDAIKAASETCIDEEHPEKGCVQIRVGFHSGPVIADVIGTRLPKYDVFGDTVNTASRMESNSETGRIHCSKASADLLKYQDPKIRLVCRGKIEVKGKGLMSTYWVGNDEQSHFAHKQLIANKTNHSPFANSA